MPAARLATTWLPAALWAGLIFALSSLRAGGSDLEAHEIALRKLAHFLEYAVLGALLARATDELPAFWLGVGYAVSDEIHQAFVPGREAAILDVAIDAAGVLAGVLALRRLAR